MPIPNSRSKLKNLILYIASKMEGAEHFGSTKLNKVLYRADMACYRELGRKLTDFKFQKNTNGPTLRAYLPVTQEMVDEGLLAFESRLMGEMDENRPVARVAPDLSFTSAEELQKVDQEIKRAWDQTGRQISNEEHSTAAWFATTMRENIPLDLCFVEDPGNVISLSHEETQRARAVIDRFRARTPAFTNPGS